MNEEEHEDVIIKDIEVFQLGMEEGINAKSSPKENCVSVKTYKGQMVCKSQGLSEVKDNNMTDEGLIDTSVGVLISSGIIELIMVVDKDPVDSGLDTLGNEGHVSGNIEPTLHVDHIDFALSDGHDVIEDDQILKDEQMHDLRNDIEKETYVKGHISPVKKDRVNPDMIADKDDLIDNSIDGLGEEA
ncbi:hypothetical protein K7X08_030900 [Anisodus acutangulus]|uniref:Uncharacterized protein n=1 Tax=Anisodus acutangulus TaxID=402998 RepID=A0A9Q1M039_9SOLA|nr:hypothetical protein K7X08_030900 [Anisodus acutangulus]